jgi:tetratricopeptide (TPR) repeat protein
MHLLRKLFDKIQSMDTSNITTDEDTIFLQAEPNSRKRMDLLWLDPPHLKQLEQPLAQHKVITVTMGDSTNLRDHDITQEDFDWAKQVERIVDKAYAAGQRGNYSKSIRYYKEALQMAPGCDLFLMSIGTCYAQLGQKAKAVQYLSRAAQISPGNARIRDNLTKIQRM